MKYKLLVTAILSALALSGCGSSSSNLSSTADDAATVDQTTAGAFDQEKASMVLETNADIALAIYNDSVTTAEALQTALATFKDDSTQANLDAAKVAWLTSREPYGQSEVYRFRLSPIDSTDYDSEDGLEGDINAWPLGEGLIDYVSTGTDFTADQTDVTAQGTTVDYPTNNIINSSVTIDADLISNTATAEDEHDVIAGYHAIEFLLWGQDLNLDGSADTLSIREESTTGNVLNSGGHRALTDFTSDQYADRRHTYLEVVAQKLVDDLKSVRDGWTDGATYRTAFTSAADEATTLAKFTEILTGMGTLSEGELAGERMQIAFSANSQEDEHSCFSDNTHRDIWLNAEGVSNSYYGEYAGYDSSQDGTDNVTTNAVSGYGFDDYLTDVGLTDVKSALEAALTATETNYNEIDNKARTGQPVDVLIMDANRNSSNPIYKTIVSLNTQSVEIANVATALGITDSVVDDDASGCDTTNPSTTCD